MKAAIRLFLILVIIIVILMGWITHQLGNQRIQFIIIALVAISLAAFLAMNLLERKELKRERKRRESGSTGKAASSETSTRETVPKRSDLSFSLHERKSGLTWGGGNIKASEATRGTKRKFLGR